MRRQAVGAVVAVLLAVTACSGGGGGADADLQENGSDTTNPSADGGTVRVVAVSRLQDQLEHVAQAYKENTGITIDLQFFAGDDLTAAVEATDRAGLYVDLNNRVASAESGGFTAGGRQLIGFDAMQIVVPPTNPAGVTGLAAFGDAQVARALCPIQKSCGRVAREILSAAGIAGDAIPADLGAGPLLDKIAAGEISASILWRTEIAPKADLVDVVEIPEEQNRRINFGMAPLSADSNVEALTVWLKGVNGRAALRQVGLLPGVDTPS